MNKFKVYFEPARGTILAISNVEQDFEKFYEVDYDDIAEFIDGNKSVTSHKVVYNITTSSYNIVPRNLKIEPLVSDNIYKVQPQKNYQLGVWKSNLEKCWIVKLSNETKEHLVAEQTRQNELLTFSITQKNNPNVLYKHFYCTLNELVENGVVKFYFNSQEERILEKFSVYTNRKFEKYTCGVLNV